MNFQECHLTRRARASEANDQRSTGMRVVSDHLVERTDLLLGAPYQLRQVISSYSQSSASAEAEGAKGPGNGARDES